MQDNNENIVTLIDDEGVETQFEHLDTLEIDDAVYIVCVPYSSSEQEVEEVVIFEIEKDDNDEDYLVAVEDDDLLETIYLEFKERNSDLFDFED